MKFKYDLHGNSEIYKDVAIYGGGSNINEGAVVQRGATPGTNVPFMILGSGALTDVAGVIMAKHVSTVLGDDCNVGGTNYTRKRIIINPFAVFDCEYDQSDTMIVVSTSGTTVTITSLEDNIDGGYLYAVAGTGAGTLAFITDSSSGSCVTKAATGWDGSTTVIKILPTYHQLIKINATGDKIGTDAAAGSGEVQIVDNFIQSDDIPNQNLNPTKHGSLTGLNLKNVKFFAELTFRNHIFNTLD